MQIFPGTAKSTLWVFEKLDHIMIDEAKGRPVSELSPELVAWMENRDRRRSELEAAVVREEAEADQASHLAISSREGGNGEVDGLLRPVRS